MHRGSDASSTSPSITTVTVGSTGKSAVDSDISCDATYKVVLFGDSGVGKTTMCNTLCGKLGKNTVSTIGADHATCLFRFEGNTIRLNIWDTAGQDKYACVMPTVVRGAKAVLLVYDVSSGNSLHSINQRWVRQISEHLEPGVPIVLIGNKVDLPANRRVTTREEAEEMATKHRWYYFESSGLDKGRTDRMLLEVTRIIARSEGLTPGPSSQAQQSPPPSPGKGIIRLSEDNTTSIVAKPSPRGAFIQVNDSEQQRQCYC